MRERARLRVYVPGNKRSSIYFYKSNATILTRVAARYAYYENIGRRRNQRSSEANHALCIILYICMVINSRRQKKYSWEMHGGSKARLGDSRRTLHGRHSRPKEIISIVAQSYAGKLNVR